MSLPYLSFLSADDDFDSTFKTNILVNSSGFAKYLPPGESPHFLFLVTLSPVPIPLTSPCVAAAASHSAISALLLCL